MSEPDLDAIGRLFAEAMANALPRPATNGTGPHNDDEPHSWTPIDLIQVADNPPDPPTISGMVYPGLRHVFSGEPEALKSWAALVLCVEQIQQGRHVMYVDYEMGQRMTLERLLALRVSRDDIRDRFTYIEPHEPFTDTDPRTDTLQTLERDRHTLIVIDAFAGALQSHGLDQNASSDVEAFYRHVINPLRSHGAAVVLLDHVVKDPATRGKFAIGSERKVGAADVHLSFTTITPFGRGRIGRAAITVHKDRPGYLTRPKIGEIEFTSDPHTHLSTWRVEYADPAAEHHEFRPTKLMEKISRELEQRTEPASKSDVETIVTGKNEGKRTAMALLIRDGYIHQETGSHGSHMLTSIRPYRESDEPSSPPRPSSPQLAPGGVKETPATSSPPLTGGRGLSGAS